MDVLYAVALGEGFFSGIYSLKDQMSSGEVLTLGLAGQGLYRALLGFLIIILSWLHYRTSTLTDNDYTTGEFVTDIVIMITYMTLFLFVDAPVAYYSTISVIWLLYLTARFDFCKKNFALLFVELSFVIFFALVVVSATAYDGTGIEWARLIVVTIAIVLYRPLNRKFVFAR